jgi:hypothetical protein
MGPMGRPGQRNGGPSDDWVVLKCSNRDTIIVEYPPQGIRTMTADNFDNVLTALRQRQPHQMFTVELHGGLRFEVDHPGAIVIRDGVAIFLASAGIPIWFDHDSVTQIIGAPANTAD